MREKEKSMNAQDLMIGDWVLCDGKSYQIAEIGGMVCLDAEEELFAFFEDIEPIPLTPEILEKNEFKIYEQDFTSNTIYKFGSLDYMEYDEYHKYFDIGCMRKYTHFGTEATYIHSLMRIKYVHELQHALKLCGIEKEIVV